MNTVTATIEFYKVGPQKQQFHCHHNLQASTQDLELIKSKLLAYIEGYDHYSDAEQPIPIIPNILKLDYTNCIPASIASGFDAPRYSFILTAVTNNEAFGNRTDIYYGYTDSDALSDNTLLYINSWGHKNSIGKVVWYNILHGSKDKNLYMTTPRALLCEQQLLSVFGDNNRSDVIDERTLLRSRCVAVPSTYMLANHYLFSLVSTFIAAKRGDAIYSELPLVESILDYADTPNNYGEATSVYLTTPFGDFTNGALPFSQIKPVLGNRITHKEVQLLPLGLPEYAQTYINDTDDWNIESIEVPIIMELIGLFSIAIHYMDSTLSSFSIIRQWDNTVELTVYKDEWVKANDYLPEELILSILNIVEKQPPITYICASVNLIADAIVNINIYDDYKEYRVPIFCSNLTNPMLTPDRNQLSKLAKDTLAILRSICEP